MTQELWLLNPQIPEYWKRRKQTMKRKRRRRSRRRMSAKQARYFGGTRQRKRRRRVYARNPGNPRRRRSRRRYRRNPVFGRVRAPAIRSIANELGWTAAGYMSTKVVGNMLTPMITGVVGAQPITRIGVKLGVAYLSAWGLASFMGQRVFMPAMIGGSLEAIQDAIKSFIAPTFPMLAANYEPLEIYYEPRMPARMGLYPQLALGDGLSPDHDAVV